jgi:hypothetical protein
MDQFVPPQPPKSFRIKLDLEQSSNRLDSVLLAALRAQTENAELQTISRAKFKKLFSEGKILIKAQRATPTSSLVKGATYVDILGY